MNKDHILSLFNQQILVKLSHAFVLYCRYNKVDTLAFSWIVTSKSIKQYAVLYINCNLKHYAA